MRVLTTRRADRDIVDLYAAGAAAFGTAQADHYHEGLKGLLDLLARNPLMARLRDDFPRPVRLYPYRAHVIAYVEHEGGILVVRVLHGRQDWARYLS